MPVFTRYIESFLFKLVGMKCQYVLNCLSTVITKIDPQPSTKNQHQIRQERIHTDTREFVCAVARIRIHI